MCWFYADAILEEPVRKRKVKHRSKPKTMTAGNDPDHTHWTDDEMYQTTGYAAPGYDDNNGLHTHTYYPSNYISQYGTHAQPPVYQACPAAGHPEPQYHAAGAQYYPPNYMVYPPSSYHVAAYEQYPQQHQVASCAPAPAYHGTSKPKSHAYAGRTKAQVNEDNSKLAKREGAHEPRKVQPIGVTESQLFWVRQSGKEDQLITFMEIKELEGDWMPNAQFPGGWYFERAPKAKKGEKKEKKK